MKKIILFIIVALFVILGTEVLASVIAKEIDKPLINEEQIVQDLRTEKIDNYFKERNMPLYGYGKKMVEVADANGLDWRLLPAISIRESSGGKHMCTNNPFGWGSCKGYTFASLDEAIETVGYKLNNLSYYKGKTTYQKLWAYNGTVIASYPDEVIAIMNKISTIE